MVVCFRIAHAGAIYFEKYFIFPTQQIMLKLWVNGKSEQVSEDGGFLS